VPPPADPPAPPAIAAVTSPEPPSTTPPTAKPPVPGAAMGAATKLAAGANASGAKPGAKPAPVAAAPLASAPISAPVFSRDTQAAQLLDVAKAKLANNLNEQALADLRQIIVDFPGSRTAAEAAFLAGEIHEKSGRVDDAMAAYVEFESRFGADGRVADAKLRRAAILGRQQRQPKAQAMSLQLLNDVARDFPGTPQAQLALQNKLRIETERRDLRAVDPVSKQDGPALIVTLRQIIEQFPETPQAMAARNRLAMTLSSLDRHAEAAAVLEDIGARGATPPDFWFRLGEIYERRLNDPAKAREAYAKVPAGSPRYGDAQRKLNRK
jgi:TolA-binding protein